LKDRQHNGKKKKFNRTNNDLQNITQKTDDRVTKTPLKTSGELRSSGRVGSSCSTSGTCLIKPLRIKPKCDCSNRTTAEKNVLLYR
jgi:4-diphosphocytidyl-2C-methyl-D-erythritol kinase